MSQCLSYEEIGQTLSRTRPAVKSLLYRARKEFRRVWQRRDEDAVALATTCPPEEVR